MGLIWNVVKEALLEWSKRSPRSAVGVGVAAKAECPFQRYCDGTTVPRHGRLFESVGPKHSRIGTATATGICSISRKRLCVAVERLYNSQDALVHRGADADTMDRRRTANDPECELISWHNA